jgi:hypothetical protein
MAVAQSLAVRDGLEPELSLLIWLRHVLDAELHTRAVRRSFVRYRDLVEDWRSVADRLSRDLELQWRGRSAGGDEKIDRFVQTQLQHHRGELESPGLAPAVTGWIDRTAAALDRLHDHGSQDVAGLADMDAVRAEFEQAVAIFAASDRAYGDLQRRVERLEKDVQQRVEAVRSSLERAAALEQDRRAIQDHLDAVERDRRALQRHAADLEKALSGAREDAQALRQSASWRITAPLRALYRLLR